MVIPYICTMDKPIFKEIVELRPGLVADINRLLTQLSSTHHAVTKEELLRILSSPNTHLYVLQHGERVIGMITLCTYQCLTGKKAWIEDVLVDEPFRGQGWGKMMVQKVIDIIRKQGDTALMLTSRPARIAANRLYRSMGFEQRETNVYRMTL